MWQLIKAELFYDKNKVIFFHCFCLASFITIWLGVRWERNIAPLTMLIMLISSFAILYSGEWKRIAYKRDRMHTALPVSLFQIGVVHLLTPFIIWMSVVLLFFLAYFIIRPYYPTWPPNPSILQLLTLNGIFISLSAVYLLYRDVRMVFTGKAGRFVAFLFWFLIYVAVLLPFYIVTNFFDLFGEGTELQILLLKLSVSPVLFNVMGMVLSCISLVTFLHRKSYVVS